MKPKISETDPTILSSIRIPTFLVHGDKIPTVDGSSGDTTLGSPVIKITNTTATETVLDVIPKDQLAAISLGLADPITKYFKFTIPANDEGVLPPFSIFKEATSSNFRVAGVYFHYDSK